MTQWEYLFIHKSRGWEMVDGRFRATAWNTTIVTNQEPEGRPFNVPVGQMLNIVGLEGWELVSISPRSGFIGDQAPRLPGLAGYTSEELWVFKRPKPE